MVNWHRKIWVIEPKVPPDDDPAADALYKAGASNEFWLEPAVTLANKLVFRVRYEPGAMESGWQGWELSALPLGDESTPFDPDEEPTEDTERLEATQEVDGTERTLQLFVAFTADGEQLHVKLAFPGGDGDDGLAIGHPRKSGP
jgi:hypothetical protein